MGIQFKLFKKERELWGLVSNRQRYIGDGAGFVDAVKVALPPEMPYPWEEYPKGWSWKKGRTTSAVGTGRSSPLKELKAWDVPQWCLDIFKMNIADAPPLFESDLILRDFKGVDARMYFSGETVLWCDAKRMEAFTDTFGPPSGLGSHVRDDVKHNLVVWGGESILAFSTVLNPTWTRRLASSVPHLEMALKALREISETEGV